MTLCNQPCLNLLNGTLWRNVDQDILLRMKLGQKIKIRKREIIVFAHSEVHQYSHKKSEMKNQRTTQFLPAQLIVLVGKSAKQFSTGIHVSNNLSFNLSETLHNFAKYIAAHTHSFQKMASTPN